MLARKGAAIIVAAPTVSSGVAYSSGDQIGAVTKLTAVTDLDRGSVLLKTITIIDKDKQKSAMDFYFFDQDPTNTVADNSAADISDSELVLKCIGMVSVANTVYADLANGSVGTKPAIDLILKPGAARSRDLWVLIVSRGTPTYTSTSGLAFKFAFEQN